MKALAILLLWATTALAGPSTTYIWIPNRPLFGIATGAPAVYDNPTQACRSFVPTLSIIDATSLSWIVTVDSGVSSSTLTVSLYSASGSTLVATSGPVLAAVGVQGATGLAPFTLVRGTKYHLCICASAGAPELLSVAGDGSAGGYVSLSTLLSAPIRFTGGNACISGNAPATIGTRSAQNRAFPYVLVGTDAP